MTSYRFISSCTTSPVLVLILLQVLVFFIRVEGHDPFDITSNKPYQIRIRAGVLQAPPFAFIDEVDDPTSSEEGLKLHYRGFHIDLIDRLKTFAQELDEIDLQVDYDRGPPHYATAVDVIANDCNTTSNPNLLEHCEAYDLILGDFYSTAERYMRVDFTPPWLKTAISTLKYINKEDGTEDLTTLKEAEAARASVCVPKLSYLGMLVEQHIPGTIVINCDGSGQECVDFLKNGTCALFADDALLLHYRASQDPTLQVTREQFRSQYLVWPMKQSLPPMIAFYMKKWMYAASNNGTLDELYHKYFQKELCPVGTAGERCELPCDPDHGTADANGDCVCRSTKWTGEDCSIEVLEDSNLLSSNLVAVCYSLVGITFLTVTGCGAWVIKNRKRAQVKVAQPSFLLMVLIGCIISTSTIIALAQEDDGNGPVQACMAIPWLYSVGFSITFGSLFAKIQRIYKLMESAAEMKRLTVSTMETVQTVGLVLVIDVTILTVWTVVDPLKWIRTTTSADQFGEPLESQGYCTSEHWTIFTSVIASFHLLLMGVACYMCYLARSIPERFSNGKYISIAMFSNLQILIVAIPVLIILGSDPVSSFFIRSLAIWINDFVVVSLIFGNLIFQVYKWDKHNKLSRISSQVSIRSDIHKYATKAKNASHSELMDETMLSSRHRTRNLMEHDVPGGLSPAPSASHSTIVNWLEQMKKDSGQHCLDSDCSADPDDLPVLSDDGKQSDFISVLSDSGQHCLDSSSDSSSPSSQLDPDLKVLTDHGTQCDLISVLSSSNSITSEDDIDLEQQDMSPMEQKQAPMAVVAAPRIMTDTEEESSEPIRNSTTGRARFTCNSRVLDQRSQQFAPSSGLQDDGFEKKADEESATQASRESWSSEFNRQLRGALSKLDDEAVRNPSVVRVSKKGLEDYDYDIQQPRIPVHESPLPSIKQ